MSTPVVTFHECMNPACRIETFSVTREDGEDERCPLCREEGGHLPDEQPHPAHVDCADGCGLAVTHGGACRSKPGGPVICTEHNHIGSD